MDPDTISATASEIGAAVENGIRTGEHFATNVYGYTDVDIEHLAWCASVCVYLFTEFLL